VGALDERWHITERGRSLAALPVSVQESRLMIEAPPELAGAVADTVALMQLEGRVVLPMGEKDQRMQRTREQIFEGCRSEVTEAIAALRKGDVKLHGLHPGRLEEGRKLSDALRAILGAPPVMKDDGVLPEDDALGGYMAKCLPEAAFTMRLRAQTPLWEEPTKPWGNGEVEVSVAPYEPYHDMDRLFVQRNPAVGGVILQNTWVGEGKSVKGTGSFMLPCALPTLAAAGVGAWEINRLEIMREADDSMRIEATMAQMLAGVVLARGRKVLTGAELRNGVAELTMRGELYPGLLERLHDVLHVWEILGRWSPGAREPHWTLDRLGPAPEPRVWLESRLDALGLSEAEELALIEPAELLPNLSALSGLADDELAAMIKDFPRQWTYMGGLYSCEIQPRTRHAWIEPLDETSKKAKLPPRELLPRFRGYGVMYKQASREVRLR
jgi:hypothetical protein